MPEPVEKMRDYFRARCRTILERMDANMDEQLDQSLIQDLVLCYQASQAAEYVLKHTLHKSAYEGGRIIGG